MTQPSIQMNGLFDAEYFDFESKHVGDTFRIFIGKPAAIQDDRHYPVIFALDGNLSFSSLLGTQRMLTQGAAVPPSFVAAIGYPGETLQEAMVNRNRDYAPTDPGENEARALGGMTPAGGPEFFQFIEQELKPLLSRKYPIDIDDSTIQGISLGGLFAAWVLLTKPSTFKRYLLGSPALWWREEQWREWERDYAAANTDMNAAVFIGAGELEVTEHVRAEAVAIAEKNPQMRTYVEDMIAWSDEHGWPEIANLTQAITAKLKARDYPSLKIHCHNLPDENHMSAPPAMTSRGMRYLHGSWTG